jgi:undecaprenyl diphosphate synthase
MSRQKKPLDLTGLHVPVHVAIIMDGNGRWAKKRGLPRQAGHRAGVENWGRPDSEVRGLMRIFRRVLDQELEELNAQGVCLHHLGDLEGIAPDLQEKVRYALDLTKNNDRLILNVAFNYGGRAEILHATQQMLADDISPEDLNEELFSSYLFTSGLPDPDLVIRTSGELRVSNFLIWQAAYAEFFAAPEYWPDFGREELYEAIVAYSQRERRFGLLSES